MAVFYKKIANGIILLLRILIVRIKKFFFIPLSCPVPEIQESLKKIQKELIPNGGGSLRDAINRIDAKVSFLAKNVSSLQVSSDVMSDTLNLCRWASDEDGKVNFMNAPLRQLIGVADDNSFYGDGWTNDVLKEDRNAAYAEWMRCVKSKIDYNDSYRIKNRRTGEVIKVTSHAKISKLQGSAIEGWHGIIISHSTLEQSNKQLLDNASQEKS